MLVAAASSWRVGNRRALRVGGESEATPRRSISGSVWRFSPRTSRRGVSSRVGSAALIAPCAVSAVAVFSWLVRSPFQLGRVNVALEGRGRMNSCRPRAPLACQSGAGRPTSYDSGLYHFSAVEYITRFAAIPGLGNLHERLGAANAHLLLVASRLARGTMQAFISPTASWWPCCSPMRLASPRPGTSPVTRRSPSSWHLRRSPSSFYNAGERVSSLTSMRPHLSWWRPDAMPQSGSRAAKPRRRDGGGSGVATVTSTRPYYLPARLSQRSS